MKILSFTTLYPSGAAPDHGIFVENRLCAYRQFSGDELRVVAPTPWFPFASARFGKYGRYAAAPLSEERRGIAVSHPRYFIPPKVGMTYAATALERCFEKAATALIAEGSDFDLIDAHYLYPDGVAAVRVARKLGKPVVLTARGSDVTLFPRFPRQRAMILDAVRQCDAVITVAAALKADLVALGAPAEKITVLRNGVDLDLFRPRDRAAIREGMGLGDGPVIASVGGLIDRKGHDIAIAAIAEIPEATLLIAGRGPDEARLKSLAATKGVAGRVRFLGQVPHQELPDIYNAADALVLASEREGWPNVLLEAMACGAPAIASNAGGCAEVIRSSDVGRIVGERTPAAFAAAIRDALSSTDRTLVRAYAKKHSWRETSEGLGRVFADVTARAATANAARIAPIALPANEKPSLIVTIDTEEEFNWSDFTPTQHKVSDPRHIEAFQALCAGFGAKPLYFLTYPLLTDARTAGYFRQLHESGAADLGLHLHQWNTPPVEGYSGEYYSWQMNLPASVHRAKLTALGEAFERAFGFRARAHRAGRYGVCRASYREIAAAGVDLDFSPSAVFDFSARGGPDFSAVANDPFTIESGGARVHVTPVCGALAVRGGRTFLSEPRKVGLQASAPRRNARRFTAPFRLSCEQARLEELVALTRHLEKERAPVLTFSLHSTTLSPGGNPYSPDERAVAAHLDLTRRYFEFFTKDFGGKFVDLGGLAQRYGA